MLSLCASNSNFSRVCKAWESLFCPLVGNHIGHNVVYPLSSVGEKRFFVAGKSLSVDDQSLYFRRSGVIYLVNRGLVINHSFRLLRLWVCDPPTSVLLCVFIMQKLQMLIYCDFAPIRNSGRHTKKIMKAQRKTAQVKQKKTTIARMRKIMKA